MALGQVFLELGAVTIALAAVGRIATRIGISPIPLYLLAGIGLGAALPLGGESNEFFHLGAEIGAVLLLFTLGLEYTEEELVGTLKTNARVGMVDLLLNFTPGIVAGMLLGLSPIATVLLGGVTYLSSSGIVSKVLTELGRLGNRETPAILAVCVLEDLAMALYLPIVAALLVGGGVAATGASLAAALAAFGVTFFLSLRFGPQLSRLISVRSDETLLLTVFGIMLLVAGAADLVKVSAAIGAFLVGIALSGDVADRARVLTAPLRDFFAAIFFVFFGLQLDLASVPGVIVPALLLALVTAVTKMITGWWGAARLGAGIRGRYRAGTTLIARGEFSILIAGLAVTAGIAPDLGPLAAVYVLITAIIGPVLARLDAQVAPPLERLLQRGKSAKA